MFRYDSCGIKRGNTTIAKVYLSFVGNVPVANLFMMAKSGVFVHLNFRDKPFFRFDDVPGFNAEAAGEEEIKPVGRDIGQKSFRYCEGEIESRFSNLLIRLGVIIPTPYESVSVIH
jgi:hypothetical protein